MKLLPVLLLITMSVVSSTAQNKPRARDLGVPFDGAPGPLNAIVDVPGVEVGHKTLISGDGKLQVGAGPVRTGVTAVWPRGKQSSDPVFGGFFSQNGNGDMTGTHWLEESGFLDGPVMITNTHSVGVVRDAYLAWLVKNKRQPGTNVFDGGFYTYPIVAETYDGFLNDINGFHVKPERCGRGARCRLRRPRTGRQRGRRHRHGLLWIQGRHRHLVPQTRKRLHRGRSRPVQLRKPPPVAHRRPPGRPGDRRQSARRQRPPSPSATTPARSSSWSPPTPRCCRTRPNVWRGAPPWASRAPAPLPATARATSSSRSPPPTPPAAAQGPINVSMLPNDAINAVFEAAVQATEEAIVNAMVGAETMTGIDGHKVNALPHDRLREVLKKYGRLQ